MNPITLEIISFLPILFDSCASCKMIYDRAGLKKKWDQQVLDEYPQDWKEDGSFLSDWIRELAQKYGPQLEINIIDAQSFLGLFKSIRYWVSGYPTFIVNRKHKYTGKDKNQLDFLLREQFKKP